MLQTSLTPEQVWRELPRKARRTIREKGIRFFIVDAFAVAKQHAPTPELETRMMGIAFIGAVAAHVDRVAAGCASREDILEKVRQQIVKKFGRKGEAVVEANMAVIRDGAAVTREVDHDSEEIRAISDDAAPVRPHCRAVEDHEFPVDRVLELRRTVRRGLLRAHGDPALP